ncbi:hypothetical protein NN561_016063 [Cricetulus griseus]
MLFLTVPGSWVNPTPFGFLLGAGLEIPTLPPLDLQHIPNQSASLQCCRDLGGRISSGFRPGESLSTKRGGERAGARGLERKEKVSRRIEVCQDMSRQPAAELRSYGRQLRRISASFPHSSLQERLGEGSRPHDEMPTPLLPAESWSYAERRLPRTQHRISPPGPLSALRLPPGLPNPVGQRFPRLGLQVMLFPFCS